jgi:CBS domain-containing protein
VDVQAFLRTCPPLDAVDEGTLSDIVRQTEIAFFPAGTSILEQSGQASRSVYVVRVGAVELVDGGRVLDRLGPGELFGHLSVLSGSSPTTEVRAQEDTICYLIPTSAVEAIFASRPGLAFLSSSLRRRLVKALGASPDGHTDPWRVRVGDLIRRAPITCDAQTSVREAATIMAASRVSCLVVPTATGYGILTDRDLRSRVVATGLSTDTTVGEVMTHAAVTLRDDALASEALRRMLENGVHHLPIVDERGALVGVVTDTDLMGLERRTPFAIRSEIERAPHVDAAVTAMGELPRAVTELVAARADPVDIGHVVGVTVDALTERIVNLTIADMDPAPQPWAWISLGSQARHEQALATDQDHAFAFADDSDPDMVGWSATLAERVTQGIEAAGIPRCRAGVGAHTPTWRRSLDGWVRQFGSWIGDVGGDGAVLTAIAFDFRQVVGPLAVERALNDVLLTARDHPAFLQHLAAQAVAVQTPTGFLRDLVVESKGEHAGRFDVKHGGLIAITSMARVLALSVGSSEKRTLSRLRDATEGGALSEEDRDALVESFHLLWQIRLEHQCDQFRRGVPVDDFVDPGEIGPITRRALREAFRSITRVQRSLSTEFGVRP